MICSSCSTENQPDRKFCGECGAPLTLACPSCGTVNAGGMKFCGECGTELAAQPRERSPAAPSPAAERRVVSVLFADLVGFTAASEGRDAEETRELLSRYVDTCRTLIERYGGTVEKFIGDAVMAVWGTPVAREDDAERAVRAALELVAAVPELEPSLDARAAVVTGEAAVTLAAEGEGMVAGELVNAASRVQSLAEAGTVLVGESTRRATEAAIAYADAVEHRVKGTADAVKLSRALRVTAARGGALKSVGLEPPFVRRARELRLIKELFHASADEHRAHLVSIVGVGGIGKSRLVWEFEKYIDGVAVLVRWHRGRCPAYGEGVTYWALAEMVRSRADIIEGEEPESAREKLHAAVEEFVVDSAERDWVEPRLAHLLGLEERQAREREDLFAGWRLFFERIAEREPVVLVFEDMEWADAALLEFIEYLLEWSRSYAIFALVLARPELVERHPKWGAGKRNFTSLALEPLASDGMDELLSGLVPGLPQDLRRRMLDRAEGIPLYAVETVRMLLDRGLIERERDVYRPAGPIEALEVPETLQALVASRLDGLKPDERRLLQDASVMGRTFSKQALAAISGREEADLDPFLGSLVRKEVLSVQADPRSPERGQYNFLQDLLRHVAYERLAKRDRKPRHLAAAAFLERAFGAAEQEVVEVVASHYVHAYEAAPHDDDAADIKAKARETLARAGERAASLAATEEAERYFAQAAELADDRLVRASLHERAGEMAFARPNLDEAQMHYRAAIGLFEEERATHPAARVAARLGEIDWARGHLAEAIERMERAYEILAADEPDVDFAALTAQLGRLQFFAGNVDRAGEVIEVALGLGEALSAPEILAQAINSFGVLAAWRGRPETALGLFTHALKVALENDLRTTAFRAYNNIGDNLSNRDRYEEALPYYASGIELARKVGFRSWEWTLLLESSYASMLLGRWDEAIDALEGVPEERLAELPLNSAAMLAEIPAARGHADQGRVVVSKFPRLEGSEDVQEQGIANACEAVLAAADGRPDDALDAAEAALAMAGLLRPSHQTVKVGMAYGIEAAFALDRLEKVEELLAWVDALRPGERTPFLNAQASRFRARLAAARGATEGVERGFKAAGQIFREYGIRFWLAITLAEHGEWLVGQLRADEAEPLLAEAREIFERLEAAPWLERLDRVRGEAGVPA